MLSPLPTLLVLLPTVLTAVSAHRTGTHKKRLNCNRPSHPRPSTLVGEASPANATQTDSGAQVSQPATEAYTAPVQTDGQTGVSTGPGTWGLKETIIGHSFLDAFTFDTFDDPTHGEVDYVDSATAASMNLTHATDSSFTLRADSFSVVGPGERGRKSVRLASKKTYTTGVVIMDLKHIPTGCGTWPAFWTVGPNWPNGGEIDIIENVNTESDNLSSLHTSAGCDMPSSNRQMLAAPTGLRCGSSGADNSGCGVSYHTQPNSFGAGFNSNGGGAYAMSRTSEAVKVWFWPVGTVPRDVSEGREVVDEKTWGTPSAVFPSSEQCQVGEKMAEHQMVINLTFCGDWAGGAYGASGCPSSCSDHVRNNPTAFNDAFFDINSLRTYA